MATFQFFVISVPREECVFKAERDGKQTTLTNQMAVMLLNLFKESKRKGLVDF